MKFRQEPHNIITLSLPVYHPNNTQVLTEIEVLIDANLINNIQGKKLHVNCIRDYWNCSIFAGGKNIALARYVILENKMTMSKGQQVDHINNNSLDNRLENLRIVSNRQNSRNRRGHKFSSSKYKGVCKKKEKKGGTHNYKKTENLSSLEDFLRKSKQQKRITKLP